MRRGKLGLYESWGFREVWVEVPDEPAPSRPAALRPGLTIYVSGRAGLRPAPASRAFAGWTAEEIHFALNEPELSEETAGVLNRVGRTLGAAQGTGPDSDPFLRRQRRESRAAGHAAGREEAWRASALRVLESRGVPVSASLAVRLAELGGSVGAPGRCGAGVPGRGAFPAAAGSSARLDHPGTPVAGRRVGTRSG